MRLFTPSSARTRLESLSEPVNEALTQKSNYFPPSAACFPRRNRWKSPVWISFSAKRGVFGKKKPYGRCPYLLVPSIIIFRQSLKTSPKAARSRQFYELRENDGIWGNSRFWGVQGVCPPHLPPFQNAASRMKQPKIRTDGGFGEENRHLNRTPMSGGGFWGAPRSPPPPPGGHPWVPRFALTSTCSCLASTNGPNCGETGKKRNQK